MTIPDLYLTEIKKQYRELLQACQPLVSAEDIPLIRKAYAMVIEVFQDRQMESGDHYFSHGVAVAKIAAREIGLGTESIISALLHNVSYKSDKVSLETLKEQFGERVHLILKGLHKIAGLSTKRSSLNPENFIKLLLTISPDVHVILLKLADRLDLMRKIDHLPDQLRKQIASESDYLYTPIAHRLGLYNIKTELDELSMKYAHSEIYHEIDRKLRETNIARQAFIEEFIHPIDQELKKQKFNCEIKGRLKSVSSIWNKMKKQQVDFDEVYDLFAIRIIIDSIPESEKDDCWKVYSIVTDIYQPNPKRLRDWITTPKASGYESLHTTVVGPQGRWVEVQIRSGRMDEIAEKGGAAHWRYKETAYNKDHDSWISQIRAKLESPDAEPVADSRKAKGELYSHDIFVFTPMGDIKKLPGGATVLDFAYEVHSTVGNTCTGAKVNNKIVPLRNTLQNGDTVEIITSKTQKPKSDWINFVVTPKAKSRIKRAIKELIFKEADAGKEILKRKFSQLRLTFDNENIDKLVDYFKLSDPLELYHNLSIGKIDPMEIKECFLPTDTDSEKPKGPEMMVPEIPEPESHFDVRPGDMLLIDGKSDINAYKFARCCNPVFGDEIFGFVTVGKGIRIHKETCPNAAQMKSRYPYRIIQAKWLKSDEKSPFWETLQLSGEDQIGLVNQISHLITNVLRISIRSFSFESKQNRFEGTIQILVRDMGHLNFIISHLKKIGGIKKIKRIYK